MGEIAAQTGTVDTAYGTNGIYRYEPGAFSNFLGAATLAPDQKLVLAFDDNDPQANHKTWIARLTTDGDADVTLDEDGRSDYNICTGVDKVRDVICQPDGKILVSGDMDFDPPEQDWIFVARFLSDGSIDTSFDANGYIEFNVNGWASTSGGLALDEQGRVIVVGNDGNGQVIAARFLPNGVRDSTFAGDGILLLTNPDGLRTAVSVLVDEEGRILIGGSYVLPPNNGQIAVTRLLDDGTPDPSFASGGYFMHGRPDGDVFAAYKMALQPDGRLILSSRWWDESYFSSHYMCRLMPDGTLDPDFGLNGVVDANVSGSGTEFADRRGLGVLSDARIIVAGNFSGGDGAFHIVMFEADGDLDTGFGEDGVLTVPATYARGCMDLVVLPDDNVIVTSPWISSPQGYAACKILVNESMTEFVPELSTNGMHVSPIPARAGEPISVRLPEIAADLQLALLAPDGRLVMQEGVRMATDRYSLVLPGSLSSGTYFLWATHADGHWVQRLAVVRR